jgi:hypothetical protein
VIAWQRLLRTLAHEKKRKIIKKKKKKKNRILGRSRQCAPMRDNVQMKAMDSKAHMCITPLPEPPRQPT